MALLKAAQEGSISKCRHLLEAGGDVGERDKSSFTPLLLAAQEGHPGVCELLLGRGRVDIEETTPDDKNTALKIAATKGHTTTLALLLT